jgi:hypothetical protein
LGHSINILLADFSRPNDFKDHLADDYSQQEMEEWLVIFSMILYFRDDLC